MSWKYLFGGTIGLNKPVLGLHCQKQSENNNDHDKDSERIIIKVMI